MRVARQLEMPSNKPEVFTDASGKPTAVPKLNNDGVTGDYLTSEGKTGDAAWGTPAKWCRLSGKIGADACLDRDLRFARRIPGYPTHWHARGYGLFSANPFGMKDFSNGKDQLNFRSPPAERHVPLSHPHRRRLADRGGDGSGVEGLERQVAAAGHRLRQSTQTRRRVGI